MRAIKLLFILIAASSGVTGCIHVDAIHTLHGYGESDSGAYRITMNAFTFGMMSADNTYAEMVGRLQRFSRPRTHADGDVVHLEDVSSDASMEHMYDTYSCSDAPVAGYVDCRFAFAADFGATPAWRIDWSVELQPGMRVLSSNHQHTRREGGRDRLIWSFDGNVVSRAAVDFTVRVRREV